MLQRILVAVVGIPALLVILCVLPPWATALLVCALCVVGGHELLSAVCDKKKVRRWTGYAGVLAFFTVFCAYLPTYAGSGLDVMPWLLSALLVLLFVAFVVEHGKPDAPTFFDLCAILVAGILIPLSLSCLLRLRLMEHGGGLVLIPLVASFSSDTAAFFTGLALGKHKLCPKVSPKKTREGAVGGLLGGMLGMVLYRIGFFLVTEVPLHISWCVALGLIGAALGQLGDLVFSCIKREYGIKDYGRLLPGHGGVLDRFDSVILATPLLWMMVQSIDLY